MAMTGDGRYGFVTSRKSKQEPDAPEIINAEIDALHTEFAPYRERFGLEIEKRE